MWKHIWCVTDPPGLEAPIKLLKPSHNFCEVLRVNMGETNKTSFTSGASRHALRFMMSMSASALRCMPPGGGGGG